MKTLVDALAYAAVENREAMRGNICGAYPCWDACGETLDLIARHRIDLKTGFDEALWFAEEAMRRETELLTGVAQARHEAWEKEHQELLRQIHKGSSAPSSE